jgi:acyl-CoA thioester hydrolase
MNRSGPPSTLNFTWPVRVYWEDTDAGGIVYYANYLRYFERARTEWLRHAGLVQSELKQDGLGMFVVTHVELGYEAPARLDDALLISVQPTEMGGASMRLTQQAWRIDPTSGQPEQLLVQGKVRAAWVNSNNLKPAKIPVSLRETLLAYARP